MVHIFDGGEMKEFQNLKFSLSICNFCKLEDKILKVRRMGKR